MALGDSSQQILAGQAHLEYYTLLRNGKCAWCHKAPAKIVGKGNLWMTSPPFGISVKFEGDCCDACEGFFNRLAGIVPRQHN